MKNRQEKVAVKNRLQKKSWQTESKKIIQENSKYEKQRIV